MKYLSSLVLLMIVLTLLIPHLSIVEGEDHCTRLVFINAIFVKNSTYNGTLCLETPQNLTLGSISQRVYTIDTHGVWFDEQQKCFAFNVSPGSVVEAYIVLVVEVCGVDQALTQRLVASSLRNPASIKGPKEVPPDVMKKLSKYVGTVPTNVSRILLRDFREWLAREGYDLDELPLLGRVVKAAQFIYLSGYIRYSPSPYPKTLEEVLENRSGDCDDMSRLLLALLWSMKVPAIMVHGYVVINGLNISIPIENTTYRFYGCGPHAFVLSYVYPYGWISLDLLAYSWIVYPFVVESTTSSITVNKTIVEEFRNLSKTIDALQIFVIKRYEKNTDVNELVRRVTSELEQWGLGIRATHSCVTRTLSKSASRSVSTTGLSLTSTAILRSISTSLSCIHRSTRSGTNTIFRSSSSIDLRTGLLLIVASASMICMAWMLIRRRVR